VNFFEPHRPYDFGGVEPDTERGITVPPYLPGNDASRAEVAGLQGAIRKADSAVGEILAALEATGRAEETLVLFTADHGLALPRDAVFAEKTYHEHYDPQRCIRTRRHKLIQRFEASNRAYLPTDIMGGPAYPPMIPELTAERNMLELYDLEQDPLERRNLAAE